MLKYGIGIDAKPDSAKHLYLEAARWGDPMAITELQGGEVDTDVFVTAPADDTNPRTQLAYGLMFLFGCKAPYAPELAFYLLEKAAEAGSADAMYVLGQAYENGIGCYRSVGVAKKWYQWGADKGNGACAYVLGWMWESGGEYGQKDVDLALSYYRRASKCEGMDDDVRSDVFYALGSILRVIEPEESMECLVEAARLGHPGAQLNAGTIMLDAGDEKGWELISQAADQGDEAAQEMLKSRP